MDDIEVFPLPGLREPFNSVSHLIAIPIFLVLGVLLVRRGLGAWNRVLSLSVMTVTTLFLLSMSTVYHMLGPGTGRDVMRQLDIAAVFSLIAGTVTPIHAILFKGGYRWGPLVLVWSIAALGIAVTSTFANRLAPGSETAFFVLMGWGGLIVFFVLWRRYGYSFVRPLLLGGIAYTVGAAVLSLNIPTLIPGIITPHEVWHIAVLVGLALHWRFVFQFAGGPPENT